MLTVRLLRKDGQLILGADELLKADGIKWIDLQGPTEASLQHLAEHFPLHKLVIEDCLHLDQRPKFEEYPGHHFVVLHGFTAPNNNPCEATLHEVHFIFGADWLITVHEFENPALENVRRRVDETPQATLGHGVDFLLYALADALVDLNFPLLDQFNEQLEELEFAIFEAPDQKHLKRLFELRRALVQMRRVLSPQRDIIGLLARLEMKHDLERTALYFRDVYDHLVRLYEQIDTARDMLGNAMEAYLSVVANRTGDVTKQLTIFATIFMPLSFIVGFFGQNFAVLANDIFLIPMLISITVLPVGTVLWFRRLGWL